MRAAVILWLLSVGTVYSEPEITVYPDSFDFGTMGWEDVSVAFYVINQGDDSLRIDRVWTSCGCTKAEIENTTIAPQDTTKLWVTFSPESHKIKGKVRRRIYIRSNDPKNIIKTVLIYAEVIPPETLSYEFQYEKLPDFAFRSANILKAYTFVKRNSDYIEHFPCYCGCGEASQHKNLRECFAEGLLFRDHASNCDVCVKEVLDIMKMKKENKEISGILIFLEEKYKTFGSPTSPEE